MASICPHTQCSFHHRVCRYSLDGKRGDWASAEDVIAVRIVQLHAAFREPCFVCLLLTRAGAWSSGDACGIDPAVCWQRTASLWRWCIVVDVPWRVHGLLGRTHPFGLTLQPTCFPCTRPSKTMPSRKEVPHWSSWVPGQPRACAWISHRGRVHTHPRHHSRAVQPLAPATTRTTPMKSPTLGSPMFTTTTRGSAATMAHVARRGKAPCSRCVGLMSRRPLLDSRAGTFLANTPFSLAQRVQASWLGPRAWMGCTAAVPTPSPPWLWRSISTAVSPYCLLFPTDTWLMIVTCSYIL